MIITGRSISLTKSLDWIGLLAFHLNDAKSQYGSRVDRHEHIGEGNIGITPFQLLANDPRFENTPMVIETPKMETMHATNLAVLRGLVKN